MKILVKTASEEYTITDVSGTINHLLETLSTNNWWAFDDDKGAVFLNPSQIISIRVLEIE